MINNWYSTEVLESLKFSGDSYRRLGTEYNNFQVLPIAKRSFLIAQSNNSFVFPCDSNSLYKSSGNSSSFIFSKTESNCSWF